MNATGVRRRDRMLGYAFVVAWSFLLALPAYRKSRSIPGDDWALLRMAGRMLAGLDRSVGPLHVYAVRTDVQVGPLAMERSSADKDSSSTRTDAAAASGTTATTTT